MSRIETQKKYAELITSCDQLIKGGQISAVSSIVAELNFAQVPNEFRQSLAKICRRAGLVNHGLRLLHPIMRDARSKIASATPGEICEYALLLSRNGSTQEALTLLQEIQTDAPPEALLYSGYCHISKWEYADAARYFEEFLEASTDPYAKLIARVNLASCYVVTFQLEEAAELLNETIELAGSQGANRLVGNCYELWGQVHFWQNDFAESRKALRCSFERLGQSQSHDQLLISKSESIMASLEQKSMEPLIKFRREAAARKHWESVREADLFGLKVLFDQNKLDHLIFGTPLVPYRQRIQKIVGAEPNSTYVLGSENFQTLDLSSGSMSGSSRLSPGKKIHQVIATLARDFYAPINLGTLFSELYPGEFFDIETSPFRVRQLIMRTRQWLKEHKIPATIEQTQGSYHLTVNGKFGIQIPLESPAIEPFSVRWRDLSQAFPNGVEFTVQQACGKLKLSRAMFHRLIEGALTSGELLKSGVGKATRYRISVDQKGISKKAA